MGPAEMIGSKKIALLVALVLAISISPAIGASKSPTPSPTKKTVVKKAPAKKAPVKRYRKKKVIYLTPSPSPKWPPLGFETDPRSEYKIYIKVPTARELVGILSAKYALASQIKTCTQFTCGAVLVASEIGCRWWQVTADVVGVTSATDKTLKTFGRITTSAGRSKPQQVVTVLVVSTEPIGKGHIVTRFKVDCNQAEPTDPFPATSYQPFVG